MPTLLLTGGTGSFGRAFRAKVLQLGWIVRVFSRDELKQAEQREETDASPSVRWLLGDVRDKQRVLRAAQGCDVVVHAAALKRVDAGEYNPDEFVKTNILGTMNVVDACLEAGVPRAVLLSTDKAVHPVNLYGATKLCAERLWLDSNSLGGPTRFSVVRYGNVVGSRGSVGERWDRVVHGTAPDWSATIDGKRVLHLSDERATRFWLGLDDAVDLVLTALERMRGGELFVPKVASSRVSDLLPEDADYELSGLGRGEKLHEMLVSDEEVARCYDCGDHFVVASEEPTWSVGRVPADFRYSSEVAA